MLLAIVLAANVSRLKLDLTWSAAVTCHYRNVATELDQTDRWNYHYRVTGHEKGNWIVYRKATLTSSRIGDTDLPLPPGVEPTQRKLWLSNGGELLNEFPLEEKSFPIDRLVHFWLPVDAPDQWSRDLKATTEQFMTRGKANFALSRKASKSREYSLTYTSPEDPTGIAATGKLWFDLDSGRLLEATIEAKHVVPPGGDERADLTLHYLDSQAIKK